jgi:hypothetical protein
MAYNDDDDDDISDAGSAHLSSCESLFELDPLTSLDQVKMPTGSHASRSGSATSNNFAKSVGAGYGQRGYPGHQRPGSSTSMRPPNTRHRGHLPNPRPQTAYGAHSDPDQDEGTGNNGTRNSWQYGPRHPRSRKGRRASRSASPSFREVSRSVSLSMQFGALSLDDKPPSSSRDQVDPASSQLSLPPAMQHVTIRSRKDSKSGSESGQARDEESKQP